MTLSALPALRFNKDSGYLAYLLEQDGIVSHQVAGVSRHQGRAEFPVGYTCSSRLRPIEAQTISLVHVARNFNTKRLS